MANLPESSTWVTAIYQIETTDYATGGVNGTANAQGKQLANRTAYLKTHMDAAEAAISAIQTQQGKGPSYAGQVVYNTAGSDPTLDATATGKLIRVTAANNITLMTAAQLGANNVLAISSEVNSNISTQGADIINDGGMSGSNYSLTAKSMIILVSDGVSKFFIISKYDAQGVVPAGAVQSFAMNTVPAGWLKCNGAAVSRTTYAALFAAIGTTYGSGNGTTTFTLPDLRGEFIRGFDDGKGTDTGRTIGSAQADELKSHRHIMKKYNRAGGSGTSFFAMDDNGTDGSENTELTGGTETRPRNVAMLYCIKY